ncbi:Nn.00g094300.m01.CDS01 [Neocucurbitaria sp. VM-36]
MAEPQKTETTAEVEAQTDTNSERQHVEYPGRWRLAAILTCLVLCMFLASLDVTVISTAIPSITRDFHSLEDVGWYGSAMLFPVAATQSIWGKSFKYFPVKVVYLFSILVFEIGSLICALSPNSATFIAGRAITGTGCAGTFSGSFLIIAYSSPTQMRPALHSILSATFAFASVAGPLIGGALTQNVSWRWCFYINLPFGAVAALAFLLAFPAPNQRDIRKTPLKEKILHMDIPGVIFISAAVICFTLAMRWAGVEKKWSSADVIGTLVGSILFVIAFVLSQWLQGERAFITGKIFRQPTLRTAGIFEFFVSGTFYIPLFYLPIYFQSIRGASAIASGVRLIPLILGLTLTQIVVGVSITATSVFIPFMIAGPAIAAIGAGLLTTLTENSSSGAWIGYQILMGIGSGACLTIPMMLSQVTVGEDDVAIATAAMIFCQATGGAFIVAAAQGIFQNRLVLSLRQLVPEVDPLAILSLGAADNAMANLPQDAVPGIIRSFVVALRYTQMLSVPIAGLAFIVSFFQPWIKYHDPHKVKKEEAVDNDKEEGKDAVKQQETK